jgi:hypothetical protein
MDHKIWRIVARTVVAVNRVLPRSGRRPRYSDVQIVCMYIWAVWHDRPMCWACDGGHYSGLFHPRRLPSVSQFSRRLRTLRVLEILHRTYEILACHDQANELMFLDGKALPVSESTQDRDAHTGHGNGMFSRGYKLHALGTKDGRITAFCVRPLNEHEIPVAVEHLAPHVDANALVLADGNYDGNRLYEAIGKRGACLLTPLRGRARSAHRRQPMSAERQWAIDLWDRREKLCWTIYRHRTGIERIFSALTCHAGGLGPLPAWVRTLRRVTQWVTAKIILYHARLQVRREVA